MSAQRDWANEIASQAAESAGNEARLFALCLEVRDCAEGSDDDRARLLEELGRQIDALRERRGIGADPSLDELLTHYDGRPPASIPELEQSHPGVSARAAVRVEHVGGRSRVFPIVVVTTPDGVELELYPEPSSRRRS